MANDINALLTNNSTYHAESISESAINAAIESIKTFAELTNSSCVLIDLEEHRIIYKSSTLLYIDEATATDKQRDCENPYWALLPDEYIDSLAEVRKNYLHYCKIFKSNRPHTHYSTTDFPIIINGRELYVNQKFSSMMTYSDGTIKLGLCLMNPSTRNKLESHIITESGKKLRYDFSTGRYIEETTRIDLSKMEKVVLTRIMKGMTSKSIATELKMSVSTVKTYRTRIFKKLGVKSIHEALATIEKYPLL